MKSKCDELANKWWIDGDMHSDISFKCGWDACEAEYKIEIDKLKAANKILTGALEFYGDRKNWRYSSNYDVGAFDAWLDFKPDHYCKSSDQLGGYTARDALENAKKIMGERWKDFIK